MAKTKEEKADPLDAMAADHDPNTTGRVRTTEMQTVGEGDEERILAPGTAMRVSADEATKAMESDPDAAVPYGQTAEIGEAQQTARKEQARTAAQAAYGGKTKRREAAEE